MSDNIDASEIENKVSLVIRKPQEGKTFICINKIIRDDSKKIHIVLTMNTLASGMQFFGRMEEKIGAKRIVVFNSNKKTAGNCHHAKTRGDVIEYITDAAYDIKVIVCCANVTRIRDSLPRLFAFANATNIAFEIHVDEAHKYIPENKEQIREFNDARCVSGIIGYSASPDNIWSEKKSDILFHKILIRDVESELNMIRSPNYFGVNRCEFKIYDDMGFGDLVTALDISPAIPQSIVEKSDMTSANCLNWYQDRYPFDLGNEMLLFGFIDYILPRLLLKSTEFSYNFMPAYTRKASHYQVAELIFNHYPTANVIISNGNGCVLYRLRAETQRSYCVKTDSLIRRQAELLTDKEAIKTETKKLLEPSYVIQQLINETPNCPTFVTGQTCVGMSVTLINSVIGNFDNVIMEHHDYSRDKLYQLCRFLFNYNSWPAESVSKIKKTVFHSLTKSVVETCLQYEEHIERMCDFAGKTCSLREIQGLDPIEPSERETKKELLEAIKLENPGGKMFKLFKMYDGVDEEALWQAANEFYKAHMGKDLAGKSMPSKNVKGFWECSTTAHKEVQNISSVKRLEKQSWWSTFQLLPNVFNYARVFVGYDSLDSNEEYTIFIKWVKLENNENTVAALEKYGKTKK